MKNLITLFLFAFIFFNVSLSVSAQLETEPIGVILNSSEANQLFGPPIKSFSINKKFVSLLSQIIDNYIMFSIMEDKIVILDRHRKVLFPLNYKIKDSDVFNVFSLSKVVELMNLYNSTKIDVQIRANNILTVFIGNPSSMMLDDGHVLEFATYCPHFCPN
jgi:hypothetical protein